MKIVNSEQATVDFETWMRRHGPKSGQPPSSGGNPAPQPGAAWQRLGAEANDPFIALPTVDPSWSFVVLRQTSSDDMLWGYSTQAAVLDERGRPAQPRPMTGRAVIQAWLSKLGVPQPSDADWAWVGLDH